jgi:hypothetical protein
MKILNKGVESFMVQSVSKPKPKRKLVNPTELGRNIDKKREIFVPAKI